MQSMDKNAATGRIYRSSCVCLEMMCTELMAEEVKITKDLICVIQCCHLKYSKCI